MLALSLPFAYQLERRNVQWDVRTCFVMAGLYNSPSLDLSSTNWYFNSMCSVFDSLPKRGKMWRKNRFEVGLSTCRMYTLADILAHIFPKCCQIAPRNLRRSWIQYEGGDFYTRTTACSKYFLYCQVCTWMRGLWNEGNRPMTKLRWRAAAEVVSIQPLEPRRDPTYLFVLAPMPSKPICLKPWRTSNSWKLLHLPTWSLVTNSWQLIHVDLKGKDMK